MRSSQEPLETIGIYSLIPMKTQVDEKDLSKPKVEEASANVEKPSIQHHLLKKLAANVEKLTSDIAEIKANQLKTWKMSTKIYIIYRKVYIQTQ